MFSREFESFLMMLKRVIKSNHIIFDNRILVECEKFNSTPHINLTVLVLEIVVLIGLIALIQAVNIRSLISKHHKINL